MGLNRTPFEIATSSSQSVFERLIEERKSVGRTIKSWLSGPFPSS
jgi:hypothetical protein